MGGGGGYAEEQRGFRHGVNGVTLGPFMVGCTIGRVPRPRGDKTAGRADNDRCSAAPSAALAGRKLTRSLAACFIPAQGTILNFRFFCSCCFFFGGGDGGGGREARCMGMEWTMTSFAHSRARDRGRGMDLIGRSRVYYGERGVLLGRRITPQFFALLGSAVDSYARTEQKQPGG